MPEVNPIHVIEPTLQDETGHCCGYVTSLLEKSGEAKVELELWVGNKAKNLFPPNTKVHAVFARAWRKLQLFFVYRKLLKANQTIFVPTAGSLDLIMLNWLARNKQHKIFLHFHQFKNNSKKQKLLAKIAQLHPEWHILAPTEKLLAIFQAAGFPNCHLTPCPTHQKDAAKISVSHNFKQLLFAGAARKDKGFPEVINLVQSLAKTQKSIPITLQISPNHSGKYDPATEKALYELATINYPALKLLRESLDKNSYQNLFVDAICLQLYDNKFYADKFSGVTLDALFAGCPIITTENTWIAATVTRFAAGIVVADTEPTTVLQAIETIIANFSTYQDHAINAGKVLRQEHDPIFTLQLIKTLLHN